MHRGRSAIVHDDLDGLDQQTWLVAAGYADVDVEHMGAGRGLGARLVGNE